MTHPQDENKSLQQIVELVESLAQSYHPDSDRLLSLLRVLEQLHRQVRTELFEPSLPNTRKGLYAFLRHIEENGGWPYIERGRLQSFLKGFEENPYEDSGKTNQETLG